MPTSMTFTSLIADLQKYLERGTVLDPLVFDQLPTLINDAEREIARELKILGFVNNVSSVLASGTSVYPKPDRWRETISMEVSTTVGGNSRIMLFPRSYEYCRFYWPDSSVTGIPEFYAEFQYANWLIVPTPNAALSWQINYYQMPALLDISNQTNWLTDYAPTTLRYRCLMEASPFLKNDERIQTWATLYKQSVSLLNTEDLQKIVDRTSTRQEA